jgi:hypothetical protein
MKSGYPEDAVVGIVRALKILAVALALGALPLTAAPQQQPKLTEVVDKIVAQEQAEMQSLRQYSPIVETYIQILRPNKDLGAVPKGDKYFLGRAELAKGVEIEPLINGSRAKHNSPALEGVSRIAERRLGTEPYQLISKERVLGKFCNQFCELLSSHMFLVLAQGCQRQ